MRFIILSILVCCLSACKFSESDQKQPSLPFQSETLDYHLSVPVDPKGLMVFFSSYGSNPTIVARETKIDDLLYEHQYAIMIMNFNERLFLNLDEYHYLDSTINDVVNQYQLPEEYVYFTGFSSGGNVALSFGIWAEKRNEAFIHPRGIIVCDAPVDLARLYHNQERVIERNIHKGAVEEAHYVIEYLEKKLGHPDTQKEEYYKYSPYVSMGGYQNNTKYLLAYALLFYSEPDLEWHRMNRGIELEEINSYQIDNLCHSLTYFGHHNVEHVKTKNKGYRNMGQRHPHAWSIMDEKEILEWIQKQRGRG